MALAKLSGIPISAGIAIGKAFFLNRSQFGPVPRQILADDQVEDEAQRLRDAFADAKAELKAIREDLVELRRLAESFLEELFEDAPVRAPLQRAK